MNPKLQAFTIIELTIAMIIAAIVSSGVLFLTQTFSNTLSQWSQFQKSIVDQRIGLHVFERDVFDAQTIKFSDSIIFMKLDDQNVSYTIGHDLIRNADDTLIKKCTHWQFTFHNHTQLVDTISLIYAVDTNTRNAIFIKPYTYHQQLIHANTNPD